MVLAVDDDPDVLAVIAATLGGAGHRVVLARSAPEAARRLGLAGGKAGGPFDLVILDLVMPKVDGLSLAARLNAHPRTAHVPVLFLTGRADLTETFGGARNVRGGLTKPFDPRGLVRTVGRLLDQPRLGGRPLAVHHERVAVRPRQ
ncbi:MAG: response regulator [Elusimicrobia bacterium]|nr:response regulator [Elusimicrobiota bacterium]